MIVMLQAHNFHQAYLVPITLEIKTAIGSAKGTNLAIEYIINSLTCPISKPLPIKSSIYFHRNCISRINKTISKEIMNGARKDLIKYKFIFFN